MLDIFTVIFTCVEFLLLKMWKRNKYLKRRHERNDKKRIFVPLLDDLAENINRQICLNISKYIVYGVILLLRFS